MKHKIEKTIKYRNYIWGVIQQKIKRLYYKEIIL